MTIILTQLLQHSSGSSPHNHLHTSCFDFIWLICFPTSFYISLSLLSSLLPCCACPLLLPCLPSHLSLPSVRLHVAFSPTSLVSLNLSVICLSSSISALPFSQLSGTPKWLCFRSAGFFPQLLQSLGVPFLSQQDNLALGATLVSPLPAVCVNCLSTVALFGTPDLQPLSLEGYRRGRQRMRWGDTIPGLSGQGFKTLGNTGLAKTRNEQPHLPILLTINSPEILHFSEFLSFPHPLPTSLILFHEAVSSKFLTILFTASACPTGFSQFSISLGVAVSASPDPAYRPLFTG